MTANPGGGGRILVLFAHPALEKSRVNRVLAAAVGDLPGVTFHDLYETYPSFDIDVPREQELLTAHETVVLQHPFFWYSTPALVKQWEDLVLEHGWAYGSEGTALRGKRLLSAVTTGGREEAYRTDGYNRYTMTELLRPLEQTAYLCGMDYLPPFVVHGTHRMSEAEIARHAADYRWVVEALRDGRLDLEKARRHPRLNGRLEEVLTPGDTHAR
jgi:glutathione-regulated potassium-efflux system ancillary protein KefG